MAALPRASSQKILWPVVALLALSSSPARAGFMQTSATCTGPQQVTFTWNWFEFNGYTTGRPEWVGYDVVRRAVNACTPEERVNAQILPRTVGADHSHTFVDATPTDFEVYQYRAIPVDVNRAPVYMSFPDCEPPCSPPAWGNCAINTVPFTVGTVRDWGWALYLEGCPGSCYPSGYFGGDVEQELRAQNRIGAIVRLFGGAWCCGVEGASIFASAWESGSCEPVPVRRTSWGELKTIYR